MNYQYLNYITGIPVLYKILKKFTILEQIFKLVIAKYKEIPKVLWRYYYENFIIYKKRHININISLFDTNVNHGWWLNYMWCQYYQMPGCPKTGCKWITSRETRTWNDEVIEGGNTITVFYIPATSAKNSDVFYEQMDLRSRVKSEMLDAVLLSVASLCYFHLNQFAIIIQITGTMFRF